MPFRVDSHFSPQVVEVGPTLVMSADVFKPVLE